MDEQLIVTPKQKLAGNIISAVILSLAALFLVLCYASVLPIALGKVLMGTIFLAIGLVFLAMAVIQGNSVAMWLAFVFFTPAVISFLADNGIAAYSTLYPLYIAAPGIGCLAAMVYSRKFAALIKAIAFFFAAAAVFLLEVFGVLSIGWTVVIEIAYLAAWIIYAVIYITKGEKK